MTFTKASIINLKSNSSEYWFIDSRGVFVSGYFQTVLDACSWASQNGYKFSRIN